MTWISNAFRKQGQKLRAYSAHAGSLFCNFTVKKVVGENTAAFLSGEQPKSYSMLVFIFLGKWITRPVYLNAQRRFFMHQMLSYPTELSIMLIGDYNMKYRLQFCILTWFMTFAKMYAYFYLFITTEDT